MVHKIVHLVWLCAAAAHDSVSLLQGSQNTQVFVSSDGTVGNLLHSTEATPDAYADVSMHHHAPGDGALHLALHRSNQEPQLFHLKEHDLSETGIAVVF